MSAKIMMVAGEASGDIHCARLAASIRELCPTATLFGMGGSLMAQAGVQLEYDISDLAVLGMTEVLGKLPMLLKRLKSLKRLMEQRKPDVLVLAPFEEPPAASEEGIRRLPGVPVARRHLGEVGPCGGASGEGHVPEHGVEQIVEGRVALLEEVSHLLICFFLREVAHEGPLLDQVLEGPFGLLLTVLGHETGQQNPTDLGNGAHWNACTCRCCIGSRSGGVNDCW